MTGGTIGAACWLLALFLFVVLVILVFGRRDALSPASRRRRSRWAPCEAVMLKETRPAVTSARTKLIPRVRFMWGSLADDGV